MPRHRQVFAASREWKVVWQALSLHPDFPEKIVARLPAAQCSDLSESLAVPLLPR